MTSSSLTNDGGISEAGGACFRSQSSTVHCTNSYARGSPPILAHRPSERQVIVAPQVSRYSYDQQAAAYDSSSNTYASTSPISVHGKSYPYPNIQEDSPQLQIRHAPAPFPNHAQRNEPHVQNTYPTHSICPPSVPPFATPSVSATLAPVQSLIQGVWTETQNQVSRTHAHYEQLLAEEHASAAEQVQKANARADVDTQRFMMLYEASQAQNNKLLAEIQALRNEAENAKRRTGKEKRALETKNGTLMKVIQTQDEEMERLKNEWNLGQAVRVKLYAENRRLAGELESLRDKLMKV